LAEGASSKRASRRVPNRRRIAALLDLGRCALRDLTIEDLGVERWSQKRTALAAVLNKNPDVVSFWAGEGARRRQDDPGYAAKLDELDERLSVALTRDG